MEDADWKQNAVAVILGPTASGKSALAVAVAKALNGEVISADSMQIYREMQIATAKPTKEEMDGVPHHLIDFVDPATPFSVAQYAALCDETIRDVLRRKKLPILVGGTGLYIDTVVQNTQFFPDAGTDARQALQQRAQDCGGEVLLKELEAIDPETARRLHPSDVKRILRALEVYASTGKTMTQQLEASHKAASDFRFCLIGLTASDRQALYDRINQRVDRMLDAGLLDEAAAFFASPNAATAKQAIGYKELKPFLDGVEPLETAVERLKRETRRYAKRQLTWFRRNPNIHWLFIDKETPQSLLEKSLAILRPWIGAPI